MRYRDDRMVAPGGDNSVFLSYRRKNNAPWALSLFTALTARGYDVFVDLYGTGSGEFRRVILENIRARAHFLVLLTPSALDRCDQPGDWLRLEIEAALDAGRNIIPLVLDGFDFAKPRVARLLTGKLAALKRYNALTVSVELFDASMDRLRDLYLKPTSRPTLQPLSPDIHRLTSDLQRAALAAPPTQTNQLVAQEYFERATAALDVGEKIRLYTQAIETDPLGDGAFNNRGTLRMFQGDLVGALQDFEMAIHLSPDSAEPYSNRGKIQAVEGHLDAALKDYDTAIRLDPALAVAYKNRADVFEARQKWDAARDDLDACLDLRPDFAAALFSRGCCHGAQKHWRAARADLDRAIELQPDSADSWHMRGIVRFAQGDADGALHDLGTAIELNPRHADAYDSRATIRRQRGDAGGAREDARIAARLNTERA